MGLRNHMDRDVKSHTVRFSCWRVRLKISESDSHRSLLIWIRGLIILIFHKVTIFAEKARSPSILDLPPHPVTVTSMIATFFVGNPDKPSQPQHQEFRLTWQWKNQPILKMYLLSKMMSFHCHVSFRVCDHQKNTDKKLQLHWIWNGSFSPIHRHPSPCPSRSGVLHSSLLSVFIATGALVSAASAASANGGWSWIQREPSTKGSVSS